MDRFVIDGPTRLRGRVAIAGAKNSALPAMAAALLTRERVVLHNLPDVRDIRTLRRLLEMLGTGSEQLGLNSIALEARDLSSVEAPYDMVKTMRASVLVLGPLAARAGEARVSMPGGCAIGVRPINLHLTALERLGATVEVAAGYVHIRAGEGGLKGGEISFDTVTVTGTENIMMAAALAKGTTTLYNCAAEPEVSDLAEMLNKMGARVEGAGTSRIVIKGVKRLRGVEHSIIPDRIEAGTYVIGAALSGGNVKVTRCRPDHLTALIGKLIECGVPLEVSDQTIHIKRATRLAARNVATSPYPEFATDLQAQYLALMTQAEGKCRITETIFENRFQHVPELSRMGARIETEGSVATVTGKTPLSGAEVMATDLRASASLVLAGLAASGKTVVNRIYHLDRGYERMELKLQALGAKVERLGGGSV